MSGKSSSGNDPVASAQHASFDFVTWGIVAWPYLRARRARQAKLDANIPFLGRWGARLPQREERSERLIAENVVDDASAADLQRVRGEYSILKVFDRL